MVVIYYTSCIETMYDIALNYNELKNMKKIELFLAHGVLF